MIIVTNIYYTVYRAKPLRRQTIGYILNIDSCTFGTSKLVALYLANGWMSFRIPYLLRSTEDI